MARNTSTALRCHGNPGLMRAWLLAVAAALPVAAHAADAPECRNGSFPAQETAFALARVVGAPRTWLRADTAPCPDDSAGCRARAYVVPGDTVVAGTANGAFVCVLYPGRDGGSAGYVRQDEIAPQPASPVPLTIWTGTWRDGDDSIVLRNAGGRLVASGEAYWPSANPSPKERPGGPNIGDFSGTAAPSGNIVVFGGDSTGECRVRLTLLPPFLLAADNGQCGGMNVSFTGVYRRR